MLQQEDISQRNASIVGVPKNGIIPKSEKTPLLKPRIDPKNPIPSNLVPKGILEKERLKIGQGLYKTYHTRLQKKF